MVLRVVQRSLFLQHLDTNIPSVWHLCQRPPIEPSEIHRDGLFPMDMAGVFEWFAQESWAAAELTHEQPQREIWLRLALMWALAALRSCEEAEAVGENAAGYLSGDAPRAAHG